MTSATEQWRRARNLHGDSAGSIHDEQQARALGFQHALIGGSYICAFVTQRMVERLGEAWYERGFLKQAFIHPLYDPDEFQVLVQPLKPGTYDEQLVEVSLETREGARITAGYAGLARPNEGVPPWQRDGEAAPDDPRGDPLPGTPLGTEFEASERTVNVEETEPWRAMAGDDLDWYTERSPWGGPIVPSFKYMLLGGGGQPEGGFQGNPPLRAAMNGTIQLLQSGPMHIGQPYTVQGRLVEKGFSARTAYRTNEFTVTDAQGSRVAIARQKIRWIGQPSG